MLTVAGCKFNFQTVPSCNNMLLIWHLREVSKLSDWNLKALRFSKNIHRWHKGSRMLVGLISLPLSKGMMNRLQIGNWRRMMVEKGARSHGVCQPIIASR